MVGEGSAGRIGKRILLVLFGIGSGLALSEAAVRALGLAPQRELPWPRYQYCADEALGFRLTPGFRGWHSYWDFRVQYRHNGQGFRDRELGPKRGGRILALGDSFTYGHGVPQEACFTEVLETTSGVEVVNAAVPSYGTRQEFIFLERIAGAVQPDIVLIGFFCGNDPHDNIAAHYATVREGYMVSFEDRDRLRIVDGEPYIGDRPVWMPPTFASHFALYRLLYKCLGGGERERRRWAVGFDATWLRTDFSAEIPKWRVTRELLARMAAFCRSRACRLCLAAIPLRCQVDGDAWAMACDAAPDLRKRDGYDREAKAARAELARVCAREGILYVDLYPAFRAGAHRGERLYFRYDPHFNRAGHRLAARIIREALQEAGWIPRREIGRDP